MSQHVISGEQNLKQERQCIQAAEGNHVIFKYRRPGCKNQQGDANHHGSNGEKYMIFKYSSIALKLFVRATRK